MLYKFKINNFITYRDKIDDKGMPQSAELEEVRGREGG